MNPKGNFAYHTGYLFAIAAAANSTPRRVGTLQEVAFSFKSSNKELMGENMFAEAVGRADTKITGQAKAAQINADAFNDIFFNQTASTGHKKVAYDEAGTIPSETQTELKAAKYTQ